MSNEIRITTMDLENIPEIDYPNNVTIYLSGIEEVSRIQDPDYEQFLADVWVGIVLTLMVLSCVCCMCSCLLYHKFQQWKRSVLESRRDASNIESGPNIETESLPSYTIVSGLPSYDEALEQLRQVKSKTNLQKDNKSDPSNNDTWIPRTPPSTRLTVSELFQLYKASAAVSVPSVDTKT